MFWHAVVRFARTRFSTACWVAALLASPAVGLDVFKSIDNRLPNPDRPYDMIGGPVPFSSSPNFVLYDLAFQPRTPSQLDVPTLNKDGNWEFDSTFDINYKAVISISTQPPHAVSGWGKARVVGLAPGGLDSFTQEYQSEVVSFDLYGLSLIPEMMFRESPTLRSTGTTTRQNTCPPCASIFTRWQISSFFDIFAEISFNGGVSWAPGDKAIHVEQITTPVMDSDFNHDGAVDAADFVAWRRNTGGMYTPSDFDLWRGNFGQSAATGLTTGGNVPEPQVATLLILLLCIHSLHSRAAKASTPLPRLGS